MQLTYQELYPEQDFAHLAQTVEQYFSSETPLWWVEEISPQNSLNQELNGTPMLPGSRCSELPVSVPAACLWLGIAVDQVTGARYPHIFLLYVEPTHRRRGVGSALMHHAERWAQSKGYAQIGLQVFQQNQPALQLYAKLGYQLQAISMMKVLGG